MPIVGHWARSGAPKAIQLRNASRTLFLDKQQHRHQHQRWRRSFTQTASDQNGATAGVEAQAEALDTQRWETSGGVSSKDDTASRSDAITAVDAVERTGNAILLKKEHIDVKSLKGTLEKLRRANRESIIKSPIDSELELKGPQHLQLTMKGRPVRTKKPYAKSVPNSGPSGPFYKQPSLIDALLPPYPLPQPLINQSSPVHPTKGHRGRKKGAPLDVKNFSVKELGNLKQSLKEAKRHDKYDLNSIVPEVLEYTGRYVLPHSKFKAAETPEKDLPWMQDIWQVNRTKRLHAEIKSFSEYIRPTVLETAARDAVIQQTQALIHKALPSYLTELFGSHRTGLGLATSDIDFRLYQENTDPASKPEMAPRFSSRSQLTKCLSTVHKVFAENHDYVLCQLRHARYPLITMQHKPSGLDLQLVCSNDTSQSRVIMKQYMREDPDLVPLFSLVKVMLDIRGLSDVYRGGLGSYSMFMMIVAALRMQSNFASRDVDLGGKFFNFLSVYQSFDTYKHGISVRPIEELRRSAEDYSQPHRNYERSHIFRKASLADSLEAAKVAQAAGDEMAAGRHHISVIDAVQPYMLCLQDPADPRNDLGRKAVGYKHIQATIDYLANELYGNFQRPLKEHVSLIAPIVGGCYDAFKIRREMAEEYGRMALETGLLKRPVQE